MDDLLSIAGSNAVAATVLALAAVAVGSVYRRPALLHGLWLLVLLKLVTPPLLFLPISWPAADEPKPEVVKIREETPAAFPPVAEEPAALEFVPLADNEEPAEVEAPLALDSIGTLTQPASPMPLEPSFWPQLVSIVWGVGALAWFLLALERLHHFRCLLRFARPASAALQERTRRLSHSLGLRRCPRVRLLPGRIAPMIWAVGGPPRLLVPVDLLAGLSDEQLDTLLVHELAHLRRRDHWVRVLEFVVMGLYWWHPVVWYARRELREAEEQCCDAWVVSTLPDAGRTYASALLDTLDFLSTAQTAVPPLASGLSQIVDLKRRLTMIMRANTPRSLTWPGCLTILAVGLTFLPMLPSLHGQAPGKDETSNSVEQAKKQLAEAQALLEKAKAQLDADKARLAGAEDALKKAARAQQSAMLEKLKGQENRLTLTLNDQKRENKSKMRIVIEFDGEGGVDFSELDKKLKEFLRAKELFQGKIAADVQITVEDGGRIRAKYSNSGKGVGQGSAAIAGPSSAKPRIVEVRPKTVTGGLPPIQRGKAPGDQEKRINDLEKKLEKVLQELQDMRKQMRQPRGRAVPPPPPPSAQLPGNPYAATPEAPLPPDLAPLPPTEAPPSPPRPPARPRAPTPPAPPASVAPPAAPAPAASGLPPTAPEPATSSAAPTRRR